MPVVGCYGFATSQVSVMAGRAGVPKSRHEKCTEQLWQQRPALCHASNPAYCRCDGTASSVSHMSSKIADDHCASLASTRIADACQLGHWSNARTCHASMFTLGRKAGRQFVPGCEVPVADVGERDKPIKAIFDRSGNGSGLHKKQVMLKSSPRE
jgi:hypothetical protein